MEVLREGFQFLVHVKVLTEGNHFMEKKKDGPAAQQKCNVAEMAQACTEWSEVMQMIQTGSKVLQLLTPRCSRFVTGSHWNGVAVISPSPLEPERLSVTGLDQLCSNSSAHQLIRKPLVIFLTGVEQRQTSGLSRNTMNKGKPASSVSKICVPLGGNHCVEGVINSSCYLFLWHSIVFIRSARALHQQRHKSSLFMHELPVILFLLVWDTCVSSVRGEKVLQVNTGIFGKIFRPHQCLA